MLRDRIRTFNKYVTNRLLHGLATSARGPFALVRHVGRRSGKPYEAVIMVWPLGQDFVVALTYGPKVDWYRNLLASEGGTIFWHKHSYAVGKPEPIAPETALQAFPATLSVILRRAVHDFVLVKTLEARTT